MFRSRLHRFLLASVVVLGVISFFVGRSVASWRPVRLTGQEFKNLPPALKHYEWYSADHKWGASLADSPTLKVWNLAAGRSITTPFVYSYGPNAFLNYVAISNFAVAANINACGEDSCGDYVSLYNLQSHRKFDVQLPYLKEKEGEEVKHLQFSPDTKQLFVLTTHGLYICDAHTGHFIKKVRVGEGESKSSLTSDGRFYIQFRNFKLSLWDVQQQYLIHRFSQLPSINAKDTEVGNTPFFLNGRIFYYNVRPKTSASFYYFIDTFSGRVLWQDESVPMFSPDGKECFTVEKDAIKVRDTHTGHAIRKLPKVPADNYWLADSHWLSADENTLYSLGSDDKGEVGWQQRAR